MSQNDYSKTQNYNGQNCNRQNYDRQNYKRRKRRRQQRIRAFFMVSLFLCLSLSILLYALIKKEDNKSNNTFPNVIEESENSAKDEFENGTATESGDDITAESEDGTTAEAGDAEWYLTLVNKWNPMQDNDGIEVMTLSNGKKIDKRIYSYLEEMFEDMRNDGIYPIVASGYRTTEEQEAIYYEKIAAYQAEGLSTEEAKRQTELWVAIPGTSEHQLGLAVDINADGVNSAGYEVYDWLEANAHQYGFINRYPEGKTDLTGVSNERWHYRYVGVEAATEIYNQGICLEEYLDAKN